MKSSKYYILPVIGAIIFLTLYIIAAFIYPGGSQADRNSVGFSWVHNYWCNLLMTNAINGQKNPAQPIAVVAMLILCITLTVFWWQFSGRLLKWGVLQAIIRLCGTAAMIAALLLFTEINHDVVSYLASFLGMVATVGVLITLYELKWLWLFIWGLLNVVLVLLNNYFYLDSNLIYYLPLAQKITFLSFLVWMSIISIKMYNNKTA